jgi:hypothetical protein
MSSEYPDVLGDLVEARQRFEVSGVHYLMALEPETISPGEATALRIWLQSCWDMPVEVAISVHLPTGPSATFTVLQKRTDVPLEAAEVGQATIPIASAVEIVPGQYTVPVTIGVKYETRGLYIRSQRNEDQLGESLLGFTTGMGLAATVGLGFSAHTRPEQKLSVHVKGSSQPVPAPDLTPTYLSHWTVDDLPILGKARQYVNDQRLFLLPKLTRQALYLAFLEESQARFKDTALPLHIGEAILLAKILIHTVEYFLKRLNGQDAILVPAYSLAFRYNLAVDDPVFLIVRADYARIARLAVSLSFGMLRQRLDRDPWTTKEQLAVADLIADRVERGGVLPAEFLYLPLLLGGLLVAAQIQMPGENLSQSLSLLTKARQQRTADLAENPELNELFDRLLQTVQTGS